MEWSPGFKEQCSRLREQGALIVILPCFSSDLEQRARVKHSRSVMDLHTASLAAGRWSGYLAIFESLQPQSMRHVHQGGRGEKGRTRQMVRLIHSLNRYTPSELQAQDSYSKQRRKSSCSLSVESIDRQTHRARSNSAVENKTKQNKTKSQAGLGRWLSG